MPPYTPVKSDAQRKKLFALARRGEISMTEARGKARAAKGRKLPKYARRKKRHAKSRRTR